MFFATNGGNISSVPKGGGTVAAIGQLPALFDCADIAVDGANVFVADSSWIWRVPKAGGGTKTAVAPSAQSQGLLAFAIDDASIFWMDKTSGGTYSLRRIPKANGANTVIAASLSLTATTGVTNRLVVDGNSVYWVDGSSAYRLPKNVAVATTPTTIPFGLAGAVDFGIDATSLFFATSGGVRRVALGGGPATTLADALAGLTVVSPAAESVYFVTTTGGGSDTIRKVGKSAAAITTVVPERAHAWMRRIVVDDTSVYWSEGANLMKAPR